MSDKTIEQPQEGQVMKQFEYGDLTLECKCGKIKTVDKAIKGGISIPLPTVSKEDRFIGFMCEECGAMLKLYFEESSPEDIAARKQLEIKEEKRKEVNKLKSEKIEELKGDIEIVQASEDTNMTKEEMLEQVKEVLDIEEVEPVKE